jgi:hypothetical protein
MSAVFADEVVSPVLMSWYLAALGLFLHVYFWGAGAAVLVLPRRSGHLWPLLAPVVGLALQTLVVYWLGFIGWLEGTDAYGWSALIVPTALAIVAWRSRDAHAVRAMVRAPARAWPVFVAQGCLMIVLLAPLAGTGVKLTAISIGSCDAADYGAGTRVLQEFASDDRSGFLGDAETVSIGEIADFRTLWVRLNHFTPAAAMALFGSVSGLRFHETPTLYTALLPVLALPVLVLLGRGVFRFTALGALAVATATSASPLWAYGVYHVAPAQISAAMAVATLGWAASRAFVAGANFGSAMRWSGVAVTALVLLLGSYNFFVLVAFAPVAGWVLWQAWRTRTWTRVVGAWVPWTLACFLVAGALLPSRVLGIWERFRLFAEFDFGWRIAASGPTGWLGAVSAPDLGAGGVLERGFAWGLLAASAVFLVGYRARLRRSAHGFATAGPVLCGYALLLHEAAVSENNASYDAYKLLAVFLPFVVAAMLPWLQRGLRLPHPARILAVVGAVGLVALNLLATIAFAPKVREAPLVVREDLRALREIEALPHVDAVDLRIDDFWSRLWANAFLLRKVQNFATHTYEGRRPTPLDARFELSEGLLLSEGPRGTGLAWHGTRYRLVDKAEPAGVQLGFGTGWYGEEALHALAWRWAGEGALLTIHNATGLSSEIRIEFDLRAEEARELSLVLDGDEVWRAAVSANRVRLETEVFAVPPGTHELALRSPTPATPAPPGDPRSLLVCLYRAHLRVAATEPTTALP